MGIGAARGVHHRDQRSACSDYGQVDVVSFQARTQKTLLELSGVGLATQAVENLPLHINAWNNLTALAAGPIENGGRPVFFTRRVADVSMGTIE